MGRPSKPSSTGKTGKAKKNGKAKKSGKTSKNGVQAPKESQVPEYKLFAFSVVEERRAQVLVRARTKREAEDYLADHQNEIDWEALRWDPEGIEFARAKEQAPFDPETFGGNVHLDAGTKPN